jgi:hypothetical protein
MSFRKRERASRRGRLIKKEFQLKSEGGEPLMQLNQRLKILLCKGLPRLVFPIILPEKGSKIYCRNVLFNILYF